MSSVSFDAFNVDPAQAYHQEVADQLMGFMETGHHSEARELLDTYAEEHPLKSDVLRLSLVGRFGTGL